MTGGSIQPLAGWGGAPHGATPYTVVAGPSPAPHHGPAAKTPADYGKAVARRAWLVAGVALVVGLLAALFVLRMKDVYRAHAQIVIESPQFDETLGGLLTHQNLGRKSGETDARYVANRLHRLRGLPLATLTVHDPKVDPPPPGMADPALELMSRLQVKQHPLSSRVDLTLDGPDPRRVTQLLNTLVDNFKQDLKNEQKGRIGKYTQMIDDRLKDMRNSLREDDAEIRGVIANAKLFVIGNRNVREEQLAVLNSMLLQKSYRLEDFEAEQRKFQLYPRLRAPEMAGRSPDDERLAELGKLRKYYDDRLRFFKTTVKKYQSDPAVVHIKHDLNKVLAEINEIRAARPFQEELPDIYGALAEKSRGDIEAIGQQIRTLEGELRDAAPEMQKYLTMVRDREAKAQKIDQMEEKLADFQLLAQDVVDPVQKESPATEPVEPSAPRRPLLIGGGLAMGLALGIALACGLESMDRKVRAPEQLALGIGLPLYGVVPRMRRTALTQRGRHVWTPAAPASVEADAYRNLRASLLGGTNPGATTTLLVTSAKEGEGKSTTALNLAATCARSGERTLLLDVDLRRPSLGEAFEGAEGKPGLVGVLRGEVPWQRTLVRTDLANLDFLPTGDPSGVPIEALGSRELRQLLVGLAGHYERIILDGPAVLGLADCRMLGQVVDAAIFVVRSGAHELAPLSRAKAMLEQSRVPIAGVVFNGLREDYRNWSSYGPDPRGRASADDPRAGRGRPAAALATG